MVLRRTLILLLLGGLAAPAAAQQPARTPDPERILEAEIRASAAQTAYELVQSLRPGWLQRRRATTIGGPLAGFLPVFLDGAIVGNLEVMHQIPASTIRRAEFLGRTAVSTRFQRDSPNGGIVLSTSPYDEREGSDAPVEWSRRDADDYFAVQVSAGWARPDGSGSGSGRLQRGSSTVVGVAVPLRPDMFMRLNYFRHAFDAASGQPLPAGAPQRVTWSGGGMEWKGQLGDTDRFTPYAMAGVTLQWLREHAATRVGEAKALGYPAGLGLDVRLAGPLTAFVETGYAKAIGHLDTEAPPVVAFQPLRAGVSVAPTRLVGR